MADDYPTVGDAYFPDYPSAFSTEEDIHSVKRDSGSTGDVSQFGALATALAATIGTGNIIGVGTAVALGGPGAVLWCWLTGVFGIATKYSEGLLAIKYRVKAKDGRMLLSVDSAGNGWPSSSPFLQRVHRSESAIPFRQTPSRHLPKHRGEYRHGLPER